MTDKPAKGSQTLPAGRMTVQHAMLGLRGRDLLATLRNVGRHGLRHRCTPPITCWPLAGNWGG